MTIKRSIQPANSPLAWFCDIPQWRCSRGCWEDVTKKTCYGHGEHGPHCRECGGDGSFEEAGSGRTSQCDACAGHGMQWDWPDEGARAKSTQRREIEAREECARRGLDPDDDAADGATVWMVVDQEMRERNA